VRVACRGLFARAVVLGESGPHRGKDRVDWDDVDYYHYDWNDYTRPGDFLLVTKAKRAFRIAPVFDAYRMTADALVQELHPRLARDPYFHPFRFEADELVRADRRVTASKIENVEIAAVLRDVFAFVHVRGEGEWTKVDVREVADWWLWLEALREREITIMTTLDLYLPPHLLELRAYIEAGARLPPASLVRR
jgi:hypothetical protein